MTLKLTVLKNALLIPHDGCAEWSYCGSCGNHIDWANETLVGTNDGDGTACPHCGHDDTSHLQANLSEMTAAELDETIEAIQSEYGELDDAMIDQYDGLRQRIIDGPTNWDVSVSDGAGGEDWHNVEGDLDDAISLGEEKAESCRYDFGDDDSGELEVEARFFGVGFRETTVTRYRVVRYFE